MIVVVATYRATRWPSSPSVVHQANGQEKWQLWYPANTPGEQESRSKTGPGSLELVIEWARDRHAVWLATL